jgi:hypothetical protein
LPSRSGAGRDPRRELAGRRVDHPVPVQYLEGWDDPKSRVIGARERMRLATGAANAALEQALAKAGS